MRNGPFVFLGLFFALALSWMGMIVTPQFQLGNEQPTNVPPANILYPTAPPGLANQGREVYRANGCAACHTQVVHQDGTRMDVVLVKPGTNPPALADALIGLRRDLPPAEATNLLAGLPKTVLTVATGAEADAARKSLSADGAEVSVRTVALGPEIERGWGTRLSVAHDYLYDVPLLLGTLRLGPDLANVGMRKPDRIWHLLHLYDPRLETSGSTMPRFPFLFQKHPRGSRPSPKALPIPGEEEIIPTPEAEALVAYLLSLRTEVPLFEAPGPQLMLPVGATNTTNAMISPSAGTNEVPAIAPSNQASPK